MSLFDPIPAPEQRHLERLPPLLSPPLEALRIQLQAESQKIQPDDAFVRYACILALTAVAEGNHGVGAVIVHNGRVIAEGRNRAFWPQVRSDLHAEMDALNVLEQDHPHVPPAECSLYSSLECCPMCTIRLINVGIGRILYAANDDECGMVRRFDNLPSGYRELAESRPQYFGPASCSANLMDCASDIFHFNLEALKDFVQCRKSNAVNPMP